MRAATLLIALLCGGLSVAQELRFQHLTSDDGLSDNAITCIYQDRAGYIWIGTENGLDRYDGNAVLPVADVRDHVAAIVEDGTGIFWIATTDHGLLRMDPTSGRVDTLRHSESDEHSIASDQLTAVFDLNDTTLLIGSREVSLIFLDKRTRAFSYWIDSLSLSPARASARPSTRSGWCHAIVPLQDDLLWIGFLNYHMSMLVDRRNANVEHHVVVRREGSESQTCALLLNDVLYSGGWQNGIDALDMRTRTRAALLWSPVPRTIPMPDETLSMTPWTNGRVLAGTQRSGLYVFDPKTGDMDRYVHLRSDPGSLLSDRIRCLLVDRGNTLWVGTANGLSRHVPSVWCMQVRDLYNDDAVEQPELTFHRVEGTDHHGIRAFTSEGFFELDSALRVVHRTDVSRNGMKLQPTVEGKDHNGGLMLGTEYGILRSSSHRKAPAASLDPFDGGLHTYGVGSMYQVRGIWPDTIGKKPVFVIGTVGYGVHIVDAETANIVGYGMPAEATNVKARSLVNSMVRDASGTYWCGSSAGLYAWHRDQPMIAQNPVTPAPPSNVGIIEPTEDVRQLALRADTLWAVTRGGSLFSVVRGKVSRHRPTVALHSAMHGLAIDHRGALWITTNDGLLRFDPRTQEFIRVPINDGRTFRKLTRAITTLADGRIAFCANNAIVVFDPKAFDVPPELPPAHITSVLFAGKPVLPTDATVRLSYRASVIDIGISALSLGHPQPLIFEYRLDGVESEWRSTTAQEMIRYAGVPVGSHVLLVRVRDTFGRTGAEQRLLTISVSGPIWQRWWFYAIGVLLVSCGLYILYRYRLAQALKLHGVRNRIASDLHDEVGSSLSSITIGSQLASQLSSNESGQLKEIMARIGETSSQSLRSMSDIVWAIDPKNDQGDALVKRMRRIAQELLESKGIEVSFSVSGGVEELKLPMNARKEIVLLFKEAVHNASKYSGAQLVQVSLHRRNALLAVSIKDDGRGFDPALHPDGHGLGSMHRRARLLGAVLDLKSAPGLGTLVGLEVDLTKIRD